MVYRVSPPPFVSAPSGGTFEHCGEGFEPALPNVAGGMVEPRSRDMDLIYWCRCFFLRTLGSTWSGMSPSRRPPTLVSGDQSV